MPGNENLCKRILLEFLDFLRYKVENDRLTMEDMQALTRMIESGLEVRGTAEDFARFYGKSVDSVRHVLHRKVFDKPKREVMHLFSRFRKNVPSSWVK